MIPIAHFRLCPLALSWPLSQVPLRTPDVVAGAFGVAAALLLIGGPLLLRYQRNRQRFELLKASIEQGLPPLTDGTPIWVRSLREGLATLTLGIGLLIVGVVLYAVCARVPAPPRSSGGSVEPREYGQGPASAGSPSQFPGRFGPGGPGARGGMPPPPMGRGGAGEPPQHPEAGAPDDHVSPDGPPPLAHSPQDHAGAQAHLDQPDRPPQPRPRQSNPAEESWHRAQDAMALAVVAMGSGFVLALLGLVRIVFSRVEARYAEPNRAQV